MDRTKVGERCNFDPDILVVPEAETEGSGWYITSSTNPFKMVCQPHPVEAGLRDACFCSDDEDISDFKTHRAAVVQYLKTQFQRIQAAASHMLEFITEEKTSGGLFDCYDALDYDFSEGGISKIVTEMVLLEQYDTVFDRDMPLHIKTHKRQHRSGFKKLYAPYGIEVDLLDDLNSAMESRSIAKLVTHFKMAVDRLDNLFLEILCTRQELFKWDIPNSAHRQCDIDPQFHRNTERMSTNLISRPICSRITHLLKQAILTMIRMLLMMTTMTTPKTRIPKTTVAQMMPMRPVMTEIKSKTKMPLRIVLVRQALSNMA